MKPHSAPGYLPKGENIPKMEPNFHNWRIAIIIWRGPPLRALSDLGALNIRRCGVKEMHCFWESRSGQAALKYGMARYLPED